MLSTASTHDTLVRLACLGAAISLEAGLLLLVARSLELDTVPRGMVRRVRWWNTHGRMVMLGGLALVVAPVAALIVSAR
ncbi:hypothetical protein [Streptomyces arenae]|uniref:hypothetical protein n=1 Tax=Streptomyces arenae TaxID=29301 RepID=UPI00265A2B89|nr:hypothetical protein [Streptomyces arenae]MCG7205133.1 hypothetical protein [Streptomyces arenae]